MELTNRGQGRLENRKVWVSEQLAGYSDFPGLLSAIKIAKRVKRIKDGSMAESVQYAVSSLSNLSPLRALSLVRGHWGIEKVCSMSKTTALERTGMCCRSTAAAKYSACFGTRR